MNTLLILLNPRNEIPLTPHPTHTPLLPKEKGFMKHTVQKKKLKKIKTCKHNMPTKNKTQNKWRNRYVPWWVRSFCCLSVLNICCHHPNIVKIYWLILEDEPLEKYFTTSPNAVSGLSVVNQSCFSPDIVNCISVPVALPNPRGPLRVWGTAFFIDNNNYVSSSCEQVSEQVALEWRTEQVLGWCGSGREEYPWFKVRGEGGFFLVFFLSWVGRGSYSYHKLCQRLLLLSTGKAENE